MGRKRLREYALANEEAIQHYDRIVRSENIDCDFERLSSVLYTTDARNSRLLRKEA